MRLCVVICAVLLLLSQALGGTHQQGSLNTRDPHIDASWYTGRGIRPVGRFGRKVSVNKRLAFIAAGAYRPAADRDSDVWIKQ